MFLQQDPYCGTAAGTFNTFTKGVKWSPDGTCLLSADDEDRLLLFELPTSATESPWQPVLTAEEGETIYDYAW